ncbi:uncharacterized protein LOC114969462 [Acropora millepora]|uniref:uncharacterized protein LOC114969462 n=1 Tax=Acropora millepora TaxID=45264 RepID=UPI001CF56742|nr:uncharacterized protein LOC114969462 [Acropora millepora]
MAVSSRTVSMVRVLAIFHIVVGALLIIFGIADSVTSLTNSHRLTFWTGFIFFGVWIGTWMCIAGAQGILGSTSQTTPSRDYYFILQAGLFMGFSITSAVMGGIIILFYSIILATVSYSQYYACGLRHRITCHRYSYGTKMGLAVVILILGIIEFVIGIWVSICLCLMKSCCTDPQQHAAGVNELSQVVDGVPVVVPLQGPGVTIQTQPFYGYPQAGKTTIGGPVHFQAIGKQPQLVVVPSPGGDIPPQYTERSQQVPLEEPILTPQSSPCSNTGSSKYSYSITSLV